MQRMIFRWLSGTAEDYALLSNSLLYPSDVDMHGQQPSPPHQANLSATVANTRVCLPGLGQYR